MIALMMAAAAAAATPGAPAADIAADPDLRCVAAISVVEAAAKDSVTAEQKAGITMVLVYYVGKLDGERPGLDYAEAFKALAASADFKTDFKTNLRDEALRCTQHVNERGQSLQQVGKALQALGQ